MINWLKKGVFPSYDQLIKEGCFSNFAPWKIGVFFSGNERVNIVSKEMFLILTFSEIERIF